jgi:hypothetical protein
LRYRPDSLGRRTRGFSEDEFESVLVHPKIVGNVLRSGQSDITIRSDKIESVSREAGLGGDRCPGKAKQTKSNLVASLFDFGARAAVDVRLPI